MKIANHLLIIMLTFIAFPFALIGLIYVSMFKLVHYVYNEIEDYHNNIEYKFKQYDISKKEKL